LANTFSPVSGAPSNAVFSESACSHVPSVSMTARSAGDRPSDSVWLASPDAIARSESNSRTGTGRPSASQRRWIVSSQSAYGVGEPSGRAGGASHVACGSRKSMRGGSSAISASYTRTGSFAMSIVHSSPP
jgi:hypothetical protein